MNSQDQDISKLSHGARNAVCGILGAVEIIELECESDGNEMLLEMLNHIRQSAASVTAAIAQIVDMARPAGDASPLVVSCSLQKQAQPDAGHEAQQPELEASQDDIVG